MITEAEIAEFESEGHEVGDAVDSAISFVFFRGGFFGTTTYKSGVCSLPSTNTAR